MKKAISLFLTITILVLFTCGCQKKDSSKNESSSNSSNLLSSNESSSEKSSDGTFKSADEIKKSISNFVIDIAYTTVDGADEKKTTISEKECDGYSVYILNTTVVYSDYKSKVKYLLDTKEKTGMKTKMDDTDKQEQDVFTTYLTNWESSSSSFDKGTPDKILGRSCKLYKFGTGAYSYQYWIDDETQICLKYQFGDDKAKQEMEVTKLEMGNVTKDNIINLSEYNITDVDALASELASAN